MTTQEHAIALLPGDGVGGEVIRAAVVVLDAAAARFNRRFTYQEALIGGAAIDATGSPLPSETVDLCRRSSAVLLGAVGGPKWDDPTAAVRPEQGLLGMRKALGVYANLRPISLFAELAGASPLKPERLAGVDFIVVRELTGGIYFGAKRREGEGANQRAVDECTYTVAEVERIVRVAGSLARTRKHRVTSVDKANVIETSRLWREVASRVMASEFPDVQLDHILVDTCAMQLIQRPADFDVIVTENMFGDILTDEAAVLAGSIGVLPSASLGDPRADGTYFGVYEPIHGSAPTIAGKNVVNPVGTILSAALMLRYSFGYEAEAAAIEQAVRESITDGMLTPDVVGSHQTSSSTEAVALAVAERVVSRHNGISAAVS